MPEIRAPKAQTCSPERGEAARKKLIEAGLKIFSAVGYEAASTRDLAGAAGVNIAAIPYYFRSKQGLYHAVIDHIIGYYRNGLGDDLAKIKHALKDKKTTQDEYRALLDDYMRILIRFVLQAGHERAQISHIYIREQLDPTSAFDRLYEGFIREAQETTATLIGRIVGASVITPEVKLLTQTLFGQISVFKLSQQTILYNMGWKKYGAAEMAAIEGIIMSGVDCVLSLHRKQGSQP